MAVNPMELRDTVLRITGVNPRKCMKCGKCSGTCPAYDQMEYHPHQFVAMVEKGDIERLMASPSSRAVTASSRGAPPTHSASSSSTSGKPPDRFPAVSRRWMSRAALRQMRPSRGESFCGRWGGMAFHAPSQVSLRHSSRSWGSARMFPAIAAQ